MALKHDIKRLFQSTMVGLDDYSVLSDFFELSAIAIRNAVDLRPSRKEYERRHENIMHKYTPEQRTAFATALAMFQDEIMQALDGGTFHDWAGEIYMESETYNKNTAQFFTPYAVSQVLSRIANEEEIKAKITHDPDAVFTIHEPTCGAGGLIVAAIEHIRNMGINYAWNVFVDCGDIDPRCVHMTYVTLSLLGVPAVVRLGDALLLDYHETWPTPAYIMAYPHFAKQLSKPKENKPTVVPKADETGQYSLF